MPLPPALLNRLKKRGLIKDGEDGDEPPQEEEVIAEDYDDKDIPLPPGVPGEEKNNNSVTIAPAPGCPNKWNIYHECATYCHSHWGSGKLKPSPHVERLRLRMLKKYPLPDGWKELYDPGTGRHYYWKIATDEVCWLSPSHPRAQVSAPAEKLRATMLKETTELEMDEPSEDEEEKSGTETDLSDEDMDNDGDEEKMDDSETSEEERPESRSKDSTSSRRRPLERIDKRGRVRAANNDLDPMDPASYSDIPRGTWSAGLEKRGDGKTGIDTTANGPLYQMRPYPNPGAVLRLNAENEKRDKK
ncbi:PQBP1 [Cordylochernes scorpioides]|uniref:Polyglutamine-binding protein 1 n=1 Tax=Cordylochernes scorpioides TaxID=51811 RepID=A0ABY6KTH4_9ARAC|nr:PQBP1 [Cordylochernes scorpioides]